MTTYYDSMFTALNNLLTVNADEINSYNLDVSNDTTLNNASINNLTVTETLLFPLNYMWSNLINQNPLLSGTNNLVATNFNNNITQTNGSTQLLDTSIGSITQSATSVIVQSGNQWNQLKQTQVTDLSITGTLSLPPNIVIAGSSYTEDLIMNNATIQQTAPTTMINTFGATDFYNGDVRLNKNLTMIGGADTLATLKNLHVEGNSNMGLIISPTISDLDTRITTNTDNILLKDDITSVNSKLSLKSNIESPTFTGTVTSNNLNITGNNIVTGNIYIKQSSSSIFFYGSSTSQLISRIVLSASNAMFWDSYISTNIQFRFGASPVIRQQFFNNGDVSITGDILNCPTITNLDSNKADKTYVDSELLLKDNIVDVNNKLLLKADVTYVDNELILKDNILDVDNKLLLKADKTYVDNELILKDNIVDVNNKLLLKADVTYVDNELILKDNILDVDSKVATLQTQIDDIIASEYYESIAVGTTTTLSAGLPATVVNSGTSINAILDFGIPMGYKGDKGDKGDTGSSGSDGKDGEDGTNGTNGTNGDSSAATAAAITAAASATAAATSATASAGSASASAASASASAASAALANTKVDGIQVQVDTLGQGMTQLDNDVIALKTKTQYVTAGVGVTSINSTLNTNTINANSLYVADSITVVDDVKASSFSGGLFPTNIKGAVINIGTGEALLNDINIGSMTSLVFINGTLYNPYFTNTNSISQF